MCHVSCCDKVQRTEVTTEEASQHTESEDVHENKRWCERKDGLLSSTTSKTMNGERLNATIITVIFVKDARCRSGVESACCLLFAPSWVGADDKAFVEAGFRVFENKFRNFD